VGTYTTVVVFKVLKIGSEAPAEDRPMPTSFDPSPDFLNLERAVFLPFCCNSCSSWSFSLKVEEKGFLLLICKFSVLCSESSVSIFLFAVSTFLF
jgi:hypothetical protein